MKSLFKMSFRNIMRNPRRTILTGTAIAVVVFILTFGQCYFFGMINGLFESFINTESGHLKIYHQGYPDKETLLPLDLALAGSPDIAAAARKVPGVKAVSERLRFFGMLDFEGENDFALGYAIDTDSEKDILKIEEHMSVGDYFTQNRGQIIIGSGLAGKFGIGLGDVVSVISPDIFGINLKVAGIFRYGFDYLDKNVFYISLEDARYLLDMEDMASEIVIMVDDKNKAPEFIKPLQQAISNVADPDRIEILPWQAQGFLYDMFQTAKYSMLIVLLILFFLAGSTIINTMMMAVMERIREIGMLMALGMKSREIMLSVLIEACSIAVFAGVAGVILGGILAYALELTGIPIGEAGGAMPLPVGSMVRPIFYWWAVPIAFAFGFLITAVAAYWPARRASRFDPARALRSV